MSTALSMASTLEPGGTTHLDAAKHFVSRLPSALRADDCVAIVTFDKAAVGPAVPPCTMAQVLAMGTALDVLRQSDRGSGSVAAGVKLGCELAQGMLAGAEPQCLARVVLLCDAASLRGSSSSVDVIGRVVDDFRVGFTTLLLGQVWGERVAALRADALCNRRLKKQW